MGDPKVFAAPLTPSESVCADNPEEDCKDEWIGLPRGNPAGFLTGAA
jgi:hypothetical protein